MSFGEILRNARIQKGLSPSEVAEGTHMLVQIVEALEREDLKRIAAPIYGRGFVKLYAEFLELDHEPLIRDFMELYDGGRVPSIRLKTAEVRVDPAPVPITRTVSEPLAPEKQAIKARSHEKAADAVAGAASARPAAAAENEDSEKPKIREVTAKASDDIVRTAMAEDDPVLIMSPEESAADYDSEPDLFNLNAPTLQRPETPKGAASGAKAEDTPRLTRGRQSPPVFKIGGRMDTSYIRDDRKDSARVRCAAIFKSAAGALGRLRDAAARTCPAGFPAGKALAFGGAGLLALIIMVSGLRVLFKMTGKSPVDAPAAVVERVAPPPELYVD